MIKKLFYGMMAATMLFATSCQQDDVLVPGGDTISFEVSTPQIATRAYSDGLTADYLHYAVYDNSANPQPLFTNRENLKGRAQFDDQGKATVKLQLATGKEYNVLFWASSEADVEDNDGAYKIDFINLQMTVNDGAKCNDEARDAFYKFYQVGGDLVQNVILTRPFAQLNIGTNDLAEARADGIDVAKTQIKVQAYNTLDLAEGKVSGEVEQVFALNARPASKKETDQNFESYPVTGYDYLAMAYVLVEDKVIKDVEFTYGETNTQTRKFNNIPLQRNYRTNIYGSLLTNEVDFNVDINKNYDDPANNVEVATVATTGDLQDAIADEDIDLIVLEGDIDLSEGIVLGTTRATENNGCITVPAGRIVTLDVAGYTLRGTDKTTKNFGLIQNNGNLTIKGTENGRLELNATENSGWNRYSAVISNNPGATLLVEGALTIEHKGGTDMAYGIDALTNGTIGHVNTTINGAIVKSTYRAVRQFLNSDSHENNLIVKAGTIEGVNNGIFFHDPSTKANKGKVFVEEGASVNGVYLFVTEGSTEWPVEVSIAASAVGEKGVTYKNVPGTLKVYNDNGVWRVGENENTVTNEADFLQRIAEVEEGETIVLLNDITFTKGAGNGHGISYTRDANFTLDLNGKTISSDLGNNTLRFKIGDGNNVTNKEVTITIKNGKIISGENNWCAISAATAENSNNKLILNLDKLEVENKKAGDYAIKSWAGTVINANNVKVTSSYGGSFYAVGGEIVLDNCIANQKGLHTAPYMSMAVAVSTKGKATVNSGTYKTEPSSAADGYNQGTSHGSWAAGVMNSGGELIINGGTFENGNYGDNALATAARGLIFGDTASKIVINNGIFNALKNIIDYQNNLGVQPNPNIIINGGDFSSNPAVVTSYGGVVFAEGMVPVQGKNGRWTLVEAASANDEASLKAAFEKGGLVVMSADIVLSETVVLAEGKEVTLDLAGKTLSAVDKNTIKNNGGNLTIKNGTVTRTGDVVGYSVNNASGEITVENATIVRGLYTSGSKMTATNANISHDQSTRHTIYAWNCNVTINSGTYHNDNAGNATLMASGSSVVVINDGKFSIANGQSTIGWTSSMIDQNSTAQVTINGGIFDGGFRINSADTKLTINGGTFDTKNGSNYTDYSGTKVIYGGTFVSDNAKNFAKKYIAEGYELVGNTVVKK